MPHIVESFKLGKTTINICDDCTVKSSAEVEEILRRVSANAQASISAAYGSNGDYRQKIEDYIAH